MKGILDVLEAHFGVSLVDDVVDILEDLHNDNSTDDDIIDCEIIESNNLIEYKGDVDE